jgi:hypothetical protein
MLLWELEKAAAKIPTTEVRYFSSKMLEIREEEIEDTQYAGTASQIFMVDSIASRERYSRAIREICYWLSSALGWDLEPQAPTMFISGPSHLRAISPAARLA